MDQVSFKIEAEPVPASRPRVTTRGVAYYPKKHTEYSEFLKRYLKDVPSFPADGPVEVTALFVMPRYKTSDSLVHRADVDNLSKLPLDSMTKAEGEGGGRKFWSDDHLIVNLTALKRFAREGEQPHTNIKIRKIEGNVEEHVDRVFDSM
ncbi:MAG: RusA family crossover junction endodeoxyribonuclease [Gammaproteobacteria bacterium]|nr:RusA family crossover junction endodeoxyribonuclease [Gammaproteobacteria bacterium]